MVPLSSNFGSETSPTRNIITPTLNTSSDSSNIQDISEGQPIRNEHVVQPIRNEHMVPTEPCTCSTNNVRSENKDDIQNSSTSSDTEKSSETKDKECFSDILRSDRTADIILV